MRIPRTPRRNYGYGVPPTPGYDGGTQVVGGSNPVHGLFVAGLGMILGAAYNAIPNMNGKLVDWKYANEHPVHEGNGIHYEEKGLIVYEKPHSHTGPATGESAPKPPTRPRQDPDPGCFDPVIYTSRIKKRYKKKSRGTRKICETGC